MTDRVVLGLVQAARIKAHELGSAPAWDAWIKTGEAFFGGYFSMETSPWLEAVLPALPAGALHVQVAVHPVNTLPGKSILQRGAFDPDHTRITLDLNYVSYQAVTDPDGPLEPFLSEFMAHELAHAVQASRQGVDPMDERLERVLGAHLAWPRVSGFSPCLARLLEHFPYK